MLRVRCREVRQRGIVGRALQPVIGEPNHRPLRHQGLDLLVIKCTGCEREMWVGLNHLFAVSLLQRGTDALQQPPRLARRFEVRVRDR